jgi:hypothetical protein
MMRLPGTVKPRAFLFAAALFAAVASPLAAQQATVRAPVGEAGATPVSAPTTPLPGPRLRAQWRPLEPSISESRASSFRVSSNHTITVSTLVLVLAVVILVLLIA